MLPLRLFPGERSVALRIPLPGRVPFRVDEDDHRLTLTLYGVAPDADWIQYGGTDSLVTLIRFAAPAQDETEVVVDLARPVWGYRTRWSGDDLLLEIRRPPVIDRRHPLKGRVIALDAGHPPLGATGPTGAYEADVVLAVAQRAQALLEGAGARVVQIRPDRTPLELVERTAAAEAADADLLVSIHANALPDGVNPFANNGTSTYYFQPRSAAFARAMQRALVHELGVRDLGMGRGDLALARPTWMPAVLTEGLFMMIPEQEEMLTSGAGQERYARGIVAGAAAFLAEWSRRP
jgi:N-acetylmuramoyl-L-alanine amidase